MPREAEQGSGHHSDTRAADSSSWTDPWAYWIDAAQRSVLFWDLLRQRGNQARELAQRGEPPVMAFDHEVVMDGRELPRPVNYILLRLEPPQGVTIDPTKRPFVIVDPRSGARPGIGASQQASQAGVAMNAGHPVYLIAFRAEPEPGQSIEDIGYAQASFLSRIAELHADAGGMPVVLGNAQAGWAVMMLAAAAPESVGLVSVAGSPLSFWAGVEGANPLRYLSGLIGGSWLISLLGDLGNGTFDGAHAYSNFYLNLPAELHWNIYRGLYAGGDAEAAEYLRLQTAWGGYFKMTKEEMRDIVDELFVGNKLTRGTILTSDRRRIDLRRISAPIVILASWGDRVAPPHQALYWIADLYASDEELLAHEQTIVYTLDDRIDHLGLFVSGRVAQKHHAGLANTLDLIDVLPPGLYEMMLDDKTAEDHGADLLAGEYLVRFESRTIDDILALGDGRDHEQAFETMNRISEINEGIYEHFVGPWVRLWSNETTAAWLHQTHPVRTERLLLSDVNPAMWAMKWMAQAARDHRRPLPADHSMSMIEHRSADLIGQALSAYTKMRDDLVEASFKAIYNAPWVEALAGLGAPRADLRKPRARDLMAEELIRAKLDAIATRFEHGGFEAAVVRMLLVAARAMQMIDARHFRLAQQIIKDYPDFQPMERQAFKALMKEQALLINVDQERALTTLPALLPTARQRRNALDLVKRVAMARGETSDLRPDILDRIESILGLQMTSARPPTGNAA